MKLFGHVSQQIAVSRLPRNSSVWAVEGIFALRADCLSRTSPEILPIDRRLKHHLLRKSYALPSRDRGALTEVGGRW